MVMRTRVKARISKKLIQMAPLSKRKKRKKVKQTMML